MKKLVLLGIVVALLGVFGCSLDNLFGSDDEDNNDVTVSLTSPTNGATDQSTSITFSWTGNASTYDVYLGTSSSSLSKIASDLTATSYTKSALSEATTYYWKVIGTKGSKTKESSIWSFATQSSSPATYTNTIGMEFILVKAGTFQMGSTSGYSDEKPVHSVTISKDYYIGKYEVTQKQWVAVMGSNPSNWKGDSLPVENVSWTTVQEFITKLNEKESTDKYRLPTEAEWEFAARGGNDSKGYTYAGSNTIGDVAWYNGNASSKTHEVGTKALNELGIYDMSGNVCEWCSDWYGSYSSDAVTDPSGASTGSIRVFRGGSWSDYAFYCRVAYRFSYYPGYSYNCIGFRIVVHK